MRRKVLRSRVELDDATAGLREIGNCEWARRMSNGSTHFYIPIVGEDAWLGSTSFGQGCRGRVSELASLPWHDCCVAVVTCLTHLRLATMELRLLEFDAARQETWVPMLYKCQTRWRKTSVRIVVLVGDCVRAILIESFRDEQAVLGWQGLQGNEASGDPSGARRGGRDQAPGRRSTAAA